MSRLNIAKSNIKAYTLGLRNRRLQNMAVFRAYMKNHITRIKEITKKRIFLGMMYIGVLTVSAYFVRQLYNQKFGKMYAKMTKLYPSIIVQKIFSHKSHDICYIEPEYDDQLAKIVHFCCKYRYKILVSSLPVQDTERLTEYINSVPQAIRRKCVILNLKNLNKYELDQINGYLQVESGLTCQQVNRILLSQGYEPIFDKQIAGQLRSKLTSSEHESRQTVYDSIVDNYPLKGDINIAERIVNLDLISAQGKYYRSSNENHQFGPTPNLTPLFIGTGGILAIPIRIRFKLPSFKKNIMSLKQGSQQNILIQKFSLNEVNQGMTAMRYLKKYVENGLIVKGIEKASTLNGNGGQRSKPEAIQIYLAKDKLQGIDKEKLYAYLQKNNVQVIKGYEQQQQSQQKNEFVHQDSQIQSPMYNLYFNVNQVGFEKFLLFLHQNSQQKKQPIQFYYHNNLLKIACDPNPETNSILWCALTSKICSEDGVLVWSSDKKFLQDIRRSTDQNQVGSQLMTMILKIQEGIDKKKLLFNHNRYQDHFGKGMFRKYTQLFW